MQSIRLKSWALVVLVHSLALSFFVHKGFGYSTVATINSTVMDIDLIADASNYKPFDYSKSLTITPSASLSKATPKSNQTSNPTSATIQPVVSPPSNESVLSTNPKVELTEWLQVALQSYFNSEWVEQEAKLELQVVRGEIKLVDIAGLHHQRYAIQRFINSLTLPTDFTTIETTIQVDIKVMHE